MGFRPMQIIVMMFLTATVSKSSGQLCSKRLMKGKWISHGDCQADKNIISNLKKSATIEDCRIWYQNKCFWFEVPAESIALSQARQLCAAKGGAPANIYSEEHEKMLMTESRLHIKNAAFVAWLGMTYDLQTATASLSNGTKAPYVKWHSGYPSITECCAMGLAARELTASPNWQHMFTFRPQDLRHGVICEI